MSLQSKIRNLTTWRNTTYFISFQNQFWFTLSIRQWMLYYVYVLHLRLLYNSLHWGLKPRRCCLLQSETESNWYAVYLAEPLENSDRKMGTWESRSQLQANGFSEPFIVWFMKSYNRPWVVGKLQARIRFFCQCFWGALSSKWFNNRSFQTQKVTPSERRHPKLTDRLFVKRLGNRLSTIRNS